MHWKKSHNQEPQSVHLLSNSTLIKPSLPHFIIPCSPLCSTQSFFPAEQFLLQIWLDDFLTRGDTAWFHHQQPSTPKHTMSSTLGSRSRSPATQTAQSPPVRSPAEDCSSSRRPGRNHQQQSIPPKLQSSSIPPPDCHPPTDAQHPDREKEAALYPLTTSSRHPAAQQSFLPAPADQQPIPLLLLVTIQTTRARSFLTATGSENKAER